MKKLLYLILPALLGAQTAGVPVPYDLACEFWHSQYELNVAEHLYTDARAKSADITARITALCGTAAWSSADTGKMTCGAK